MSVDLVPSPNRQQRAAKGSPIDRADRGKVTGRLKAALDMVVNEGADPYEAAAKVGYHARSMRLALDKRHVLAYLRQAREVLRCTASAQNIHHAIAMRANARNEMARLGAMKLIEGQDDERSNRGGSQAAPGLVIVVQGTAHVTQQRDNAANPLIEHAARSSTPDDNEP